ncbi:hypothetical protein THASP1DRAFT_35029 [Thamnocephalis sphaerospora]|uniref:Indoleamine 2,3-dioxygenase n=1 Tax=Thamnocephalis sphaerospora TaxID=78915 RepID=A0A4P9XNH4_9FUNG|nr:hypothetical protein THASP1DRAFT_35029 [Thamnocephalis sphaerospora]|eukprot:RKP06961.1 hypothetical protein THASP1DRAFT_35029 [Thamnocephalis sphaerospora]
MVSTTFSIAARVNSRGQDQFSVDPSNGFLPREAPLVELPSEYAAMESLLRRMSLLQPDGSDGLLVTGEFGAAVDRELPEYDLSHVTDTRLLSALYRDLTFVASAYLLEPCDLQFRRSGSYGLGRQVLPRNIAVPLSVVAHKIGAKPFMEYALSYALYNYRKIEQSKPLGFDNLALVRGFSNDVDERGFILVHVSMVSHSGALVSASLKCLEAVETGDRQAFNAAMADVCTAYGHINDVMETMWNRSAPEKYLGYRTFIMGTKNQPMFPNGVLYEGVSDQPFKMRGESGANDSMVPLGDNLLELTAHMPSNPLTEVLRDFRSYRPRNHRLFLEFVQRRANTLGLRDFACADANSAALYLANLDMVRAFRHRHWLFTKEYIIKRTAHPVATGGSPIVTWLPNQLATVLNTMVATSEGIQRDALTAENRALVDSISKRADAQRRVLTREVARLVQQRGVQASQVDAVEKDAATASVTV